MVSGRIPGSEGVYSPSSNSLSAMEDRIDLTSIFSKKESPSKREGQAQEAPPLVGTGAVYPVVLLLVVHRGGVLHLAAGGDRSVRDVPLLEKAQDHRDGDPPAAAFLLLFQLPEEGLVLMHFLTHEKSSFFQ